MTFSILQRGDEEGRGSSSKTSRTAPFKFELREAINASVSKTPPLEILTITAPFFARFRLSELTIFFVLSVSGRVNIMISLFFITFSSSDTGKIFEYNGDVFVSISTPTISQPKAENLFAHSSPAFPQPILAGVFHKS